jgi:hypothetical protein
MPVARFQMPDGRIGRFEVPDGTTPEQAQSLISQSLEAAPTPRPLGGARQAAAENNPTGSFMENVAAGAGKTVYDVARGAGQRLRSVLPERAANSLGLPTQADIDEARVRDEALTATVGGKVGQVAGALPVALIPGANTLAGATAVGAGMGFLQPTAADESVLQNTAIGGAAGAAGKVIGDKVAGFLTRKLGADRAAGAALETQNAARDAALAAGKEAGYVIPPSQAKPGLVNGLLEGMAGKIRTAQDASVKNQRVTNELARKALGVADDVPITKEVLSTIRNDAGKAYEAIRGAGQIMPDAQFGADLAKVTAKFQGAAKDFPELAKNEVADIVASVNKPQFSTDAAVDALAILRERAGAAYAKGDKSLGGAYKQISQALEDAIERNLRQSGQNDLLNSFRDARTLIAKTYTVEKALNQSGNVNAQVLAKELNKGRPLTDELRLAAKVGANFPKATQNVDAIGSTNAVSPLDVGVAMMSGNPLMMAARPAARAALLSPVYQRMMSAPSYGPGATQELLTGAANSPILRALLAAGAPQAALANGGKQ